MLEKKANATQSNIGNIAQKQTFNSKEFELFIKQYYSPNEAIDLIEKTNFQYFEMYLRDIQNSDFHEEARDCFIFLNDLKKMILRIVSDNPQLNRLNN
jgi:hypothetical protein